MDGDFSEREAHSLPNWEALGLHAWLTVTMLHTVPRPLKPNKKLLRLAAPERRDAMLKMLKLPEFGSRTIGDAWGNEVHLDNRIVDKMATAEEKYLWRLPYLAWVPDAPILAVEVWQQSRASEFAGSSEVRDYYLVPIANDGDHDGYVVIVGEDRRIFNTFPFKSSYADAALRRGTLLYKSYEDSIRCSTGCCKLFADERRSAGTLRDENRRMQLELRDQKKALKASKIEQTRLAALVELLRSEK